MARGSLPISKFTLPNGSPLSNGYVVVQLNRDGQSSEDQICPLNPVRIGLDSNGVLVGSPTFATNLTVSPSGTVYIVNAYTSSGQLVLDNLAVTVV